MMNEPTETWTTFREAENFAAACNEMREKDGAEARAIYIGSDMSVVGFFDIDTDELLEYF